jgi:hypothetical protein
LGFVPASFIFTNILSINRIAVIITLEILTGRFLRKEVGA